MSVTKRIGKMRWLIAALAVALLLTGLAALPATAQKRAQAVPEANNFISWCFGMGGTPNARVYGDGGITVTCDLGGQGMLVCDWLPPDYERDCLLVPTGWTLPPHPSEDQRAD